MVEISEGDDPLLLRQRMVPGTELKTILSNAKRWRGRKRLRGFYEAQNSQIARFLIPLSTLKVMEDDDHERKKRKRYKLLIDLTLFSTLLISAIQIYAAILSRSSSIALITVDSVIDILAGAVVKLSNAKIRRVDQNKYPCGGSRFRSIGNVCYAFLMMTANIYVASESAKAILTSSGEDINKDLKSIIPPSISLLIKTILFLVYLPIRNVNSQIRVLFEDQRNDIILGIFGLTAFLFGSRTVWYIDPVGAIILSLAIVYCWMKIAKENFSHLAGVSADSSFLQFVTYKAMTFSNKIIMIDSCKAYHSGPKYFIEVDIVMDPRIELRQSHDVAQELQDMLEELDDVDRAFVHVDYETSHKPEHVRSGSGSPHW